MKCSVFSQVSSRIQGGCDLTWLKTEHFISHGGYLPLTLTAHVALKLGEKECSMVHAEEQRREQRRRDGLPEEEDSSEEDLPDFPWQ
jgi:hypothetical protein